ncbi:hypothetical protein CYMTET_14862 [Cymbomonas tetramitiformis]|uniref:Uncharacterized protein n=1 Tax=Cymbomonas tetramitiformis TaxID=36881 RepID=A0AAE0L9H9_9CHLO|nr:hypothetical protein CYMTET_14862 [Cymbomonas tetramitiformis]
MRELGGGDMARATRGAGVSQLQAQGSSALAHCYNTERDVFKSKYLNVLDWIFGNTGHSQQSIRHVPSNLQTITPYIEQVEKSAVGQHVIAPIKKALSFQNLASEGNLTQPTPEGKAAENESPPHDQVKTA